MGVYGNRCLEGGWVLGGNRVPVTWTSTLVLGFRFKQDVKTNGRKVFCGRKPVVTRTRDL